MRPSPRRLPWRSVLEISYIGNRSANEYMDGTNSNLYNLNNVPTGGMFSPDPIPGMLTFRRPLPRAAEQPEIFVIASATRTYTQ